MLRLQLKNQNFGKLFVIKFHESRNGRSYWLCRCECGQKLIVRGTHLTCQNQQCCTFCKSLRHGEARKKNTRTTVLYRLWLILKHRKGRCLEWDRFENFRDWMLANGWQKGLWIHRKGDKGIYSPENCYIGTCHEGALGGRSYRAKLIPIEVEEIFQLYKSGNFTQKQLAEKFDVSESSIWSQLHRQKLRL